MRQPIGDQIDSRGVLADMAEGDLLADAVVIMRIVDKDGRTSVRQVWSEGMDWISRRGLIEIARDTERIEPQGVDD